MSGPIIDPKPYSVVCAGVRLGPFTRKGARTAAVDIIREWTELGYRRSAEVFYRDGSIVEVVR